MSCSATQLSTEYFQGARDSLIDDVTNLIESEEVKTCKEEGLGIEITEFNLLYRPDVSGNEVKVDSGKEDEETYDPIKKLRTW